MKIAGDRSLGRSAVIAACVALLASACRVNDLAFRQDERVEILTPEQRSKVVLPFHLRWTVRDFDIVGPDGSHNARAGYFAVLVDASPMPPGANLTYFARDDDSCLRTPGCPDETYLADRDVHLTTDTSFAVDTLRDTRPINRRSVPDEHAITIVLLNGRGERIGESAFKTEFTVDRGQG
jgi:hypothetical protein